MPSVPVRNFPKKKKASLPRHGGTLPRRTRQAVGPTALPVWRKHICWAGGRIPSTHLRRVAIRIFGCSTDLCRWRELTLGIATRRAAGITHGTTEELASAGVAARRVGTFAWVAIFSIFHDTVSTHLERDCLATRVRIRETTGIHTACDCALHQRAWQRV